MLNRKDLARKALAAALEIRKTKDNFLNPICIYDLAEELNIGVWFADIPSLEGMYSNCPKPAIIIGAERPAGRRVYSFGNLFQHGTGRNQFSTGVVTHNGRPLVAGKELRNSSAWDSRRISCKSRRHSTGSAQGSPSSPGWKSDSARRIV